MKTIYIFKIPSDDGHISYRSKLERENHHVINEWGDIKPLAESTKEKVKHLNQVGTLIAISFSPPYDIECLKGCFPVRCIKFTPEEQEEFWRWFK